MVGYPYTKYAVAVMDVDMAAALIVATHERADALGVPPDRRVYLRGWCYATDPVLVAEHPDMWRSPAMEAASAEALRVAGVGADDVRYFDLYSCFASSLHFACDALGLAPDRRARADGDRRAALPRWPRERLSHPLDRGDGRAASCRPRIVRARLRRRDAHDQARLRLLLLRAPAGRVRRPGPGAGDASRWSRTHEGDAEVAAYSVVHGRDGAPEWALLVCDVAAGSRTYAHLRDPEAVARAEREELVGTKVRLTPAEVDGPDGQGAAERCNGVTRRLTASSSRETLTAREPLRRFPRYSPPVTSVTVGRACRMLRGEGPT